MAARFGAVSPAQTYAAKVRWVVGGLVAVILILVVTLILVAQGSQVEQPVVDNAQPGQGIAIAATTPAAATTDILVSVQRIEEGSRIEPFMVDAQPVLAERVPEGAILADRKTQILGKFANHLINANLPILENDLSETHSALSLPIPPGFRAVTITVDARTAVEGWAKPNSRVDVLWTYRDRDGQNKVATIVRFSKILSVGGMTNAEEKSAIVNGATTVTLLTTEQDAKKIELARTLGSLSLSLVGEQEQHKLQDTPEVVTIETILGNPSEITEKVEEPADGVMYSVDAKTGKQVRYVLRRGRWKRDTDF